ncbi:MAG TPA: aspartate-semialdehyde dehydrogenase [Alphaproteobacteria bacterium]
MAKSSPPPTNIAIVGATSLLGRDILTLLAEQQWRGEILALDAGRYGGDEVSYGEDRVLAVHPMDAEDLTGIDIVIHAGDARDAAAAAKKAQAAGAWLIDTSGIYAMDPSVPLVMSGVNDNLLDDYDGAKKIIALPGALAGALSIALNPLHQHGMLKQIIVSTYQSVSVHGRAAQNELFNQTKKIFMAMPIAGEVLPKQLAFNAWPMVGDERDDGMTDVEFQTISQLKRIFGKDVKVSVNTVIVPAFTGDGMMVNIDCVNEMTAIKAALVMTAQPGLGVIDQGETMPTHADINGEDMVFIARLRNDSGFENGLSFWALADNPRAGLTIPLLRLLGKLTSQ